MSESPLRLAVNAHPPGSGFACAMQVLSWEQGDHHLSTYPANVARPLARMVQHVNDYACAHTTARHGEPELLCAPCSMQVLELAHRTVDTAGMSRRAQWQWVKELLVGEHGIIHGTQDAQIRSRIMRAADAADNGKASLPIPLLHLVLHPTGDSRRLTFAYHTYYGASLPNDLLDEHFPYYGRAYVDIDLRGGSIACKPVNPEVRLTAASHAIDAWERATGVNAPEPDPVALARVTEEMRELAAA